MGNAKLAETLTYDELLEKVAVMDDRVMSIEEKLDDINEGLTNSFTALQMLAEVVKEILDAASRTASEI